MPFIPAGGIGAHRHKNIRRRCVLKARRHHTDDPVVLAVDQHRFADDIHVCAKAAPPQLAAQNHDALTCGRVLVFCKAATEGWADAEDAEEIH